MEGKHFIVSCVVDMTSFYTHRGGQVKLTLNVSVLGANFMKYMDAFKPFLGEALKNHQEHQVENAVYSKFTVHVLVGLIFKPRKEIYLLYVFCVTDLSGCCWSCW